MRYIIIVFSLLASCMFVMTGSLRAQTFTFDGNTGTAGQQNGSGTWNTSLANWIDSNGLNTTWLNDGTAYAAFGNSLTATGGTITVTENVKVSGMRFNSLSTTPTGTAHTITSANGSTLTFADNATITMAEFSSTGASTTVFVNLNLGVIAHNLTVQRDPTGAPTVQTFQYLRFANDNTLTGTLTLAGASSGTRGIFLLTGADNTLSGLDKVIVQAGSVLAANAPTNTTGHTYTTAVDIAGNGANNGVIRVDGANINFAGRITVTADAGIMTNAAGTNALISGGIGEASANLGFARFAAAVDTVLSITGASNYTGLTTLGRSGAVAGGITVLDFSGVGAPETDILYNGVTAGGLTMIGGTSGRAALVLQGKAGTNSAQHFGATSFTNTRSTIALTAGTGGRMDLYLGSITRVQASTTLGITVSDNTAIYTTQADTILGPWATIADATGNGGWAQASGGQIIRFSGNTNHATDSTLAGYTGTTHLTLGTDARAVVTGGATSQFLNSLSQTDTLNRRLVDIGAGNTLRLAQVSGIQMTANAKDLIIGRAGSAGILTAGTAATPYLFLTNMSSAGTLTVNSQITDSGSFVLGLHINGTGNVVLNNSNTFTGTVQISAGTLEIRNGGALGGGTGATTIYTGGALRLAGGISSAEAFTLNSTGVNVDGGIRNVSGNNVLTGLISLGAPSRINSDAGTSLTLQGATLATNVMTSSSSANTIVFGGAGTTIINGRLNLSSVLTKDGTGLLVLNGDNAYATATTVSNGILRIGHNNALGTTAGITTVNGTGSVELNGNGLAVAEPITLGSTGTAQNGGLRNTGGNNSFTGLITVNNTSRIQSVDGTLTLDHATGANAIIKDDSSVARTLTFGGAGNIIVMDAIARQNTGAFAMAKDGAGTLTLKANNTYDGTTTLAGGEFHLDFSSAASETDLLYNGITSAGALTLGGGTFRITGKSGTTTSQRFGNLAIGQGQVYFKTEQNGATAVNVAFGNISRANAGSLMEFTPPSAGTFTTTGGVDNAIISHDGTTAFTWGKSDWAATTARVDSKRNIVGLSSIAGGYTAATATTLAGNADVTAANSFVLLSADTSITSLRFNAATSAGITLNGATLTTGGILVGEGVGARDVTISGGTIRSNSTDTSFNVSDLVIIQNNTQGALIISSVIANNSVTNSSTSLTKGGAGTVVLDTAANTYRGTTKVVEGTLHLRTASISTEGQYTLGGGTTSGKFKMGNNTQAFTLFSDWLRIDGTGTANALVGGGTTLPTFLLDGADIVSDFRLGFIGGTDQYENNISIRMAADNAPLQLGAFNTFAGKTTISFGIIEVEKLANLGEVSSLGTGTFNGTGLTADSGIIDLSNRTTGSVNLSATSILRYTGSTDSSTNRVVRVSNSAVIGSITSVIAVLENVGTGTVKFTSGFLSGGGNDSQRVLRLAGTNTGRNEIVSFVDASVTVNSRIEKTGTGTWAIMGNSTHTGGTDVLGGTLLAMSSTGSSTGTGNVTVANGGTLGGTGRVAPGSGKNVTINSGGRIAAGDSTTTQAGALTIATTGSGVLTFKTGSSLVLDLFSGAGGGDQTLQSAAADVMVVNGILVIETGATLVLGNPTEMIDWAVNDQWKLFDWSGITSRTGEFTVQSLPGIGGGLAWDTSKLYTDGTIAIMAVVVPEPSRAVLMMLAVGVLVTRRRKLRWAAVC